jgi:hypothetical protein
MSTPSVAPSVVGTAAIMSTTSSVILTGKVRPNQLQTVCYFEYGTSSQYGHRTKDLTIRPDTGAIEIRDTVRNLLPGTVYHFRVVASNSAGLLMGPDSVFVTLVEFVFPLTVGNRWQYHYYYWQITPEVGGVHEINGSQSWQIVTIGGGGPPFDVTVAVVRLDTIHDSVHNVAYNFDTTYVTQTQTTFPIVITTDSLRIGWPSLMTENTRRIPRTIAPGIDTLTIRASTGTDSSVRYVQGIGLVRWKSFISAIHAMKEELVLLSYSQ